MADYTEYFTKCCNKEYIVETDEFMFRGILLNYERKCCDVQRQQ